MASLRYKNSRSGRGFIAIACHESLTIFLRCARNLDKRSRPQLGIFAPLGSQKYACASKRYEKASVEEAFVIISLPTEVAFLL